DSIVVFDVLRPELVRSILGKFLLNVAANAKRLHGLEVTFDEGIGEACMRLQDNDLGGRAVRSFVDTQVVPALNVWALQAREERRCIVRWNERRSACEVSRP